ncbi:MAG: radical SAM family heme chaperone HemW [Planctomycetia bacterium]|nr:radical SAM family heme chaperone HemW [Planctomycetia bacterium]
MPPWLHPRAAYVHVPFCAHHCGYCDFAVTAGQDQLMTLYVEALGQELATLSEPCPVDTVFIGGGTPTYLTPPLLERLLAEIRRWLPLHASGEWSIEATPESLDAGKVALLADHGVTRVSIGAQSFHPQLLQRLERIHNPDDVPRAVECVRERIAQVSLDLIFGVPGQSVDDWDRDLRRALRLQPEHVATYGLTYEKGTPLWKRWQGGQVQPLGEDDELAMYCRAMDVLSAAGFEHYEVSNFARPGRRCRHNQVYWANHAYFGFGVGAARYVQGRREMNTRDTHGYIRRVFAGEKPLLQAEELPPEERARETLALQLRRADGVRRGEFQEQTGFDLDALAGAKLRQHAELGLIEDNGACVRLTRSGKCVADALMAELL